MAFSPRLRELMKKYGKVALGVHFTVSAASIAGLYASIKNNVDVESLFNSVGLSSAVPHSEPNAAVITGSDAGDPAPRPFESDQREQSIRQRNRTAELAASSGGALALAILCNKALFPVRVPITIVLTPPIARFLARRNIVKNL